MGDCERRTIFTTRVEFDARCVRFDRHDIRYRDSGLMNLHKTSRVEFVPVGVVGAIVPWNYPFHNVFNPLISAVS
jgi:acyl-CoA reductase-like NAD-dependent aldehyde dehydrogenase